ncbi:MAG: hypothetical protein ACRDBL_11400 [Rhabdaerophilum sp.]
MLGITGLARIAFPTRVVRLCDGGFFTFAGETYLSADDVFGNIGSIEPLTEGVGNEVPALNITFQPPSTSAAGLLSQPGFQRASAKFWIAEYDTATGLIVGTPELTFLGQVDQTTLGVGRGERSLANTIVSTAERLFAGNIGNTQSPNFHKSIWPGELGHDNATGLGVPTAWGVASPAVAGGSGGSSGFGSGVLDAALQAARQ